PLQHAAPPPASPLSLHDALPIFRLRARDKADNWNEAKVAIGPGGAANPIVEDRRPVPEPSGTLGVVMVNSKRISLNYQLEDVGPDRKSTRLNSSHQITSYAVFCL